MARRKRKGRTRGWWLIVAVALLIAGFMVRRLMMPSATRYLTYHAPAYSEHAQPPAENDSPPEDARASSPNDNGPREHLTDRDRRALDEVIRRKTGGN